MKTDKVKPKDSDGNGSLENGALVADIGRLIASRRKTLGLSLRRIAERSGVSRHALKTLEAGESHDCKISHVEQILSAMEISSWELFNCLSTFLRQGSISEGTLKGEFQIQYQDLGLKITSLASGQKAFFFGLFQLEAKRMVAESKLPKAEYLLFQGFQGKFLFSFKGHEALLSEEKHFLFQYPSRPEEIYNPDPIKPASCFLLTVPSIV
jgi:transcriptional regulator with XRE-family HTH domain